MRKYGTFPIQTLIINDTGFLITREYGIPNFPIFNLQKLPSINDEHKLGVCAAAKWDIRIHLYTLRVEHTSVFGNSLQTEKKNNNK